MALPYIIANQTSNIPGSYFDTNFSFLEAQGVQGIITTGSPNAYVIAPSDAWVTGYSLYKNKALVVTPNFTNTGATTGNVSGLGNVNIYKNIGGVATALTGGEMVNTLPAILVCDGANLCLTNPTPSSSLAGVSSVTNSDGTITVSPTTGAVVVSGTTATNSQAGVVKPDGTIITVSGGNITVPKASSSTFGVVEVDNITITASGGVISAASGSGGVITPLNTQTASNSASVVFSSTYINSTYNKYIIEFNNVLASSASNSLLQLFLSTNNGSTYQSSYYITYVDIRSNATTNTPVVSESYTCVPLTGSSISTGRAAYGIIRFSNPNDTSTLKLMNDVVYYDADPTTAHLHRTNGTGDSKTASAINNIKIIFDVGNIAAGTFKLYGVN